MKAKLPALICIAAALGLLAFKFAHSSKADLDVSIKHADYIMPAVYKVYANPDALNGEYYLFKMLVTNKGSSAIKDVKVSYRIPNFIDWTDLESTPAIYPGQNAVFRCYPVFKEDIVTRMTQSQEKVEIKITYNGNQTEEESYGFKMMGRNQFVYTDLPPDEIASYPDMNRNDQLLGCYVTPQDPIIKYYTQQVQEKVMKGEEASVDNKPESAAKFLAGVYAATYVSHMVYSGTEGIPQKLGDVNSLVQSMRLPREVVTGNTGLCIELSLLYASILKSAGLHPVIFLIPGHAYPGVLAGGQYYAIEATGVGGEGLGSRADPEAAFKAGMKELDEFIKATQSGDPRYSMIDIDEMEAKGVVPMELKDDEFLRKKVDDIAASFSEGTRSTQRAAQSQQVEGGGQPTAHISSGGNNSGGGNTAGYSNYAGAIAFSYPGTWERFDRPFPQFPFVISAMQPANRGGQVEVFEIQGAQNPDQAMNYISQTAYRQGVAIRFQRTGQNNGYSVYQGTTQTGSVTSSWYGVFRAGGSGVVGITCGSPNYRAYQAMFNNIFSTVR